MHWPTFAENTFYVGFIDLYSTLIRELTWILALIEKNLSFNIRVFFLCPYMDTLQSNSVCLLVILSFELQT